MVLIPTLNKRIMEKEKMLKITAKYGSLEFSEIADPYIPSAEKDQARSCVESIVKQIVESGKAEMMEAFKLQKSQVIEKDEDRA